MDQMDGREQMDRMDECAYGQYTPYPAPEPRQPRRRSGFGKGFLAGLVAALMLFGVGILFYVSYQRIEARSVFALSGSSEVLTKEVQRKIRTLETYIDHYFYFDDDVAAEDKQEGLYKGLLESLDDEYSVYFTREEAETLNQDIGGFFYGIGALLTNKDGIPLTVISGVLPDSPAEKAGLMPGDQINSIDGESAYGMTVDEVVTRVRGEKDTIVELEIYREGESDYLTFSIKRDQISETTVYSEMLEDGIGLIQITEFASNTPQQWEKELASLREQGMKGLVIDLRYNPGGSVDSVTKIAGDILPEGLVFYMEDKYGQRTNYTCDGADLGVPLVLLVNEYSASASEILSGAVQDAGVGTLVGTTTFGKGIVQTVFELGDGSSLKLTVANYYTRDGRNIHKVGITPDVELELDTDAYTADGTDNQLDKAMEILKQKIGE